MKKLMIAMTLLAACSLTVQAEKLGGVDFEGRATGSFDPTKPDVEGGDLFWSRTTDDGDSEIVAEENPANQYLKIDESGVLSRAFESGAELIPENGGISVASKVQFTAQDAEDPAPTLEEGAKLAIWMKKYDGEVPTNVLVVTAGKRDGNKVFRVDYEFKGDVLAKALEENVWYDVEIKAEMNADSLPGFKIYFAGAELVNPDVGLFLSLDPQSTTIASLGFKGTGAADDLVFESYVNEQPIEVAISGLEAVDLKTLTYQIDGEAPVEIKDDLAFQCLLSSVTDSLKIHAEAIGYVDFDETYTADQLKEMEEDGAIEITVTMMPTAVDPTATVKTITVGGYDVAVQFDAGDIGTGYDNWVAKFYLTSDVTIGEGEVLLGGQYGTFGWTDKPFTCMANMPVSVLAAVGLDDDITVKTVFDAIKSFKCGVKNIALKNDATFKLELVITDGETTKTLCTIGELKVAKKAEEAKEIKPGETATDIVAETEAEALAQVTIKPINDEAAEAGQAAVIMGKATQDGETKLWTVEPVINELAGAFKAPDVVVETTLEQIVAGTDGEEVTVTLPAEKVTPGLYYSVDVATELGATAEFTEGARVLATSAGVSLKVTKPTGGKAFFKVSEHMAPTNK